MAEYLGWAGKLISKVGGFYSDMNPATLTGANDVIIIKQEDGTYNTSPWHIRFGKMGVFWTSENNVDVEINGQQVNLPMKLGTAGDAIFAINFEDLVQQFNQNISNSVRTNIGTESNGKQREQCSGTAALLRPRDLDANDSSSKTVESNFSVVVDKTNANSEDMSIKMEECTIPMDCEHQLCEESNEPVIPLSKMRCNSLPQISLEDLKMPMEVKALSDNSSDAEVDSSAEDDQGCIVGSLPSQTNEFLSSLRQLKNSPASNLEELNWQWNPEPPSSDNRNNNIANVVSQAAEAKEGQDKKETSTKGKAEGVYLDQLIDDPELMSLYIYPNNKLDEIAHHAQDLPKDVDCRSDPGLPLSPFSAPHSPVPFDEGHKLRMRAMSFSASDTETMSSSISRLDSKAASVLKDQQQEDLTPAFCSFSNIDMSLCGGSEDLHESALLEKFEQNKVSFKQFASNPALLNDPALVVRIGGKFFKWAVASSMIMCTLAFQEPLPDETRDSLMKQHMPQKSISHRRRWLGGWFSGREKESTGGRVAQLVVDSGIESDGSGPLTAPEPSPPIMHNELSSDSTILGMAPLNAEQDLSSDEQFIVEQQQQQPKMSNSIAARPASKKPEEDYAKVLTLSAKQIELMNLHEGRNEVTFSITTKYQGTTKCHCSVFLWNWFDKIVISDIDGTITKSDVLGQVLPIISSTWIWSQIGIANLYTLINQNGYKFIYLSARAIGQAKITRDYLRSVKQGEYLLPDGPLLLCPSSLRNAFQKEVIERKPEEFKIKCLKNILSLFPSSAANPFMAGFGNRVNDVFAYNNVGIPKERIFIVNTKGQLRIEKSTTFSSTYSRLSDIVDQIFPPVAVDPEYSSFNYWRDLNHSVSEDEALQFLGLSKSKRARKVERAATLSSGTPPAIAK